MTSSRPTLSDLLKQNDFAELAAEKKRQGLIKEKEAAEQKIKEEQERKELERLAALPKITEEDLKKAEEAGYERGVQEGKEQATIEQKSEFEANLSEMQRKLENLPDLLKVEVAYIQRQSLSFINQVLQKILRNATESHSEEVLTFMLEEALAKAPKAELIVRLSPADRFYLQEKGSKILNQTNVKFKEDENISRGGCIVEWDNSGVDARLRNVINELDTFIKAASDHVNPDKITLQYKADETGKVMDTEPSGHTENTKEDSEESNLETDEPLTAESVAEPLEQTDNAVEEIADRSEDVTSAEENKNE